MSWTWYVHTDTDHVRGESTSILRACGWVQAMLERSTGIAEAEISAPTWPVVRLAAVDGSSAPRETTATTTITGTPMTTTETILDETDLTLLTLTAKGLTGEMIAQHLDISNRTLRRRMRALCERLNVHTPIEAVVWAAKHDLI